MACHVASHHCEMQCRATQAIGAAFDAITTSSSSIGGDQHLHDCNVAALRRAKGAANDESAS